LKKKKDLSEAKVSDFISRLKGHLSIKSINLKNNFPPMLLPGDIKMIKIKRALLLHSYFKRHAKDILARAAEDDTIIQPELRRAFLEIEEYEHGARSMEAIVEMSRLAGEAEFRTSALPPRELLDLHVNGQDFLRRAGIGE
jgi:hypothetical protein